MIEVKIGRLDLVRMSTDYDDKLQGGGRGAY
jgi:hypothetical protein